MYTGLTSASTICFALEKTYPLVDIVHPGFMVRILAPSSSVELPELGSSKHFVAILLNSESKNIFAHCLNEQQIGSVFEDDMCKMILLLPNCPGIG